MTLDVDQAVAAVLDQTRVDPTPPVDVLALAYEIGVDSVATADLVEDGNVRHDSSGTHILVSSHINRARRRFTLAHELGHILLAEPGQSLIAKRHLPVRSDEERLCDEIAAAILMPRAWISANFTGRTRTLASARELAEAAITSLAASVVRLNQVLRWRRAFLRWRWRADRWRLVAAAGVPPGLHGTITSSDTTREQLQDIERLPRGEHFLPLSLAVGGRELLAPAFVEVRGTSALALVDLSSAVRE